MPASLAPISPELFADFKAGKETALEQVFRANFEAFTQEANEKLDDPGGAQKVAASAFLDIWDRRAKLESVDQMQSLLHQAVAGEAAHEMRRRAAAHHMAGNHAKTHEPAPAETLDQWWAKVSGVLHAAHADPSDVAKQRAEHSRHEAAAHMKKVAGKKRTGFYGVMVIVLALAAGIPLWYLNKGAEGTKAQSLLNKEEAKSMRSKDGQRGTVTMEDSVVVRLGSSTYVKYSESYPLDARAMQIIGVAAIKAPKLSSPLLVKVGNVWVHANDAEFIGRSFMEDSNSAMLKTLSGTVTVVAGKTEKSLAAGATMLVLSNGTFMDLDENRAEFAFGWIGGNFDAHNQPLRKVLAEFRKWYGIEITPKDSSFLDRPVSMSASLDSSKVAMKALEEGGAVKVTLVSETKATLVDNAANVKKPKK
jgi:ferric-dicitrate binding protein FerR (iron transport regulator)